MNEKTRKGMGSHLSNEWFTPKLLFDEYDNGKLWHFHFRTDPCTSADNPMGCEIFYTIMDDGMTKPWFDNVWVNPPYGREVDRWVSKCAEYAKSGRGTVVMLSGARTDTRRFHKYIWNKYRGLPHDGVFVDFLKGRIKFLSANGGSSSGQINSAFFPSMAVIFYSSNDPKWPIWDSPKVR